MGTIAINAVVNAVPLSGDELNTAHDIITNVINGNLDGDNINVIPEAKITFADASHDHSGGIKGTVIDAADLTGNLNEARLPLAVLNGAKGGLLVESNVGGAAIEIDDGGTSPAINLSNISQILSLQVFWEAVDGQTNRGYGQYPYHDRVAYEVNNIGAATFKIKNALTISADFYWYAIGI